VAAFPVPVCKYIEKYWFAFTVAGFAHMTVKTSKEHSA